MQTTMVHDAEEAYPRENSEAASIRDSLLAHKGSESARPNVLHRQEHQDSNEIREMKGENTSMKLRSLISKLTSLLTSSDTSSDECTQPPHCPFHGSQLQPEQHGEVTIATSLPLARFLMESSHEYGVAFVRSDIRALVSLEAYMQEEEPEIPLETEHYLDIEGEVEVGEGLEREAT